MNCGKCGVRKLSDEFWMNLLHNGCNGPPNMCLRCLQKDVSVDSKCVVCGDVLENAEEVLSIIDDKINFCLINEFGESFREENVICNVEDGGETVSGTVEGRLLVRILDGYTFSVPFKAETTIVNIAKEVAKVGNMSDPKKLLLKTPNGDDILPVSQGRRMLAKDYNLRDGSEVFVVVNMYVIEQGSEISNIALDINWTFPAPTQSDFLDGSCLACCSKGNGSFPFVVDYQHIEAQGVTHSGDVMTTTGGTHKVKIDLQAVPAEVDHLFIILSAYHCGSLANFVRPSVYLYDQKNESSPLSDFTVTRSTTTQAVIMCSVSRSTSDGAMWKVTGLGAPSSGTVRDYTPMKGTIRSILNTVLRST